jgi:hypothetical protein
MKYKYLWILTNIDSERAGQPAGGPIIRQLIADYYEKIISKSLPKEVFSPEHKRYKNHKDLFIDLCALAECVYSNLGFGGGTFTPLIDAYFTELHYSNADSQIQVRSSILRRQVVDFFTTLSEFSISENSVLSQLPNGKALLDKIQNEFLNDNIDLGLERIRRFRTFKSSLFKINMFAFIFTLVVGLLVLSSLSDSYFTQNLLLLPMTLGIISVALLTITLNRLLHSD